MKRKASISWEMMFIILICAVAAVLTIYAFREKLFGMGDDTDRIRLSATSDYDGDRNSMQDGGYDAFDDNPCFTGEDTVLGTDGITYLYVKDAPPDAENSGDCGTHTSRTGKIHALLLVEESTANDKPVCVMEITECNRMIADWYNTIDS